MANVCEIFSKNQSPKKNTKIQKYFNLCVFARQIWQKIVLKAVLQGSKWGLTPTEQGELCFWLAESHVSATYKL